jgi:hypothetical protein
MLFIFNMLREQPQASHPSLDLELVNTLARARVSTTEVALLIGPPGTMEAVHHQNILRPGTITFVNMGTYPSRRGRGELENATSRLLQREGAPNFTWVDLHQVRATGANNDGVSEKKIHQLAPLVAANCHLRIMEVFRRCSSNAVGLLYPCGDAPELALKTNINDRLVEVLCEVPEVSVDVCLFLDEEGARFPVLVIRGRHHPSEPLHDSAPQPLEHLRQTCRLMHALARCELHDDLRKLGSLNERSAEVRSLLLNAVRQEDATLAANLEARYKGRRTLWEHLFCDSGEAVGWFPNQWSKLRFLRLEDEAINTMMWRLINWLETRERTRVVLKAVAVHHLEEPDFDETFSAAVLAFHNTNAMPGSLLETVDMLAKWGFSQLLDDEVHL